MWLQLEKGEIVKAQLDISSIRPAYKHWTGDRCELCLGDGCPLCIAGIPKRRRYQVALVVEGKPASWEFGELVMRQISGLDHHLATVEVNITRRGQGRKTRYEVSQPGRPKVEDRSGLQALPPGSKYLGGKYGHMVRH